MAQLHGHLGTMCNSTKFHWVSYFMVISLSCLLIFFFNNVNSYITKKALISSEYATEEFWRSIGCSGSSMSGFWKTWYVLNVAIQLLATILRQSCVCMYVCMYACVFVCMCVYSYTHSLLLTGWLKMSAFPLTHLVKFEICWSITTAYWNNKCNKITHYTSE